MRRPGPVASFGQTTSGASGMAGWLMRHGHCKIAKGCPRSFMWRIILVDIIAIFVVIKYLPMKTHPKQLPMSIYVVLISAFLANVVATYLIIKFLS